MPSCLRQLGDTSSSVPPETVADLRSHLAAVPDPRSRRGIRHPWTALLSAAAAAVLAGAASVTAIGEWVADAPQRVLALPGFRPDPLTGLIRPPHATTIRLALAAADGDTLDRAIGDFLQQRKAPVPGRRVIAVDGKTLRGSRTIDRSAIALIAAMTHSGQVLAQRQADGKSNEIPAFAPLLDGIDLAGAVVTADALHTQHDHACYLHERGAHYLAVVKRNHPGLHEKVRRLPWRDIRLDHYERCPRTRLSALWQREPLFDEQGLLRVRGMIAMG
ncbi:ISAs1 family transposase [Streptomyces sp. NEAU-W12]|uniref:ISAs1 family transposase n=1 Tax=Streptomyces sp. NEAU-W12 TaxID=2994668 RepID=UPI00224B88A1|nr:ISAs1 family transposase [Streptomyces sp. NEAU-W12]MCX2928397.1 ISAs1 family transposase [Streptomyces sp. NEAU-W12]